MMKITDLPSKTVFILIRMWRYIFRPFFPQNACIFEPTCSRYTEEAIREHGILKGALLGAWRILRCNPWNKGGFDPVKTRKREEY